MIYVTSEPLRDRLQVFCATAFPGKQNLRIASFHSLSAGWESDVYAFDLEYGQAGERKRDALILRVYPGDDASVKSAREFRGMSQLFRLGYPVPKVWALEGDGASLGRPFVIMERIQGQMLWPLLFHDAQGTQGLLTLFCQLFVELHQLDWRPFVEAASQYGPARPFACVDRELAFGRAVMERYGMDGFLPVLRWLEARRDGVPCPRPSPVHWDFHPGNVLLCDDGTARVVDWTQVGVSDARFDLAWTLLLVGTHENVEWRHAVQREYERLAGSRVAQMDFFDVFACAKRLLSVVLSLSEGPEKLGMRPGAEEQMREQMGAIGRAYELLLERTGIAVPEAEQLLTSAS